MIQRIQSVFLFVAAILLSLDLFMPFWSWGTTDNKVTVDAFNTTFTLGKFVTDTSTAYVGVGLIITILLSLYIILQFKNRSLQMKLCLLNALLIFGVTGLMYWATKQAAQITVMNPLGDYTIAFFFPALAVMLHLFAMRSIKKDEELVRSADRMR